MKRILFMFSMIVLCLLFVYGNVTTHGAEKAGIRPPTISAICTGTAKHLPVDVIDKICTVLNCQPGDFIQHIPDQPKEE